MPMIEERKLSFPIKIINVNVDDHSVDDDRNSVSTRELVLEAPQHYLLFWKSGIPIGQAYVGLECSDIEKLIATAMQKTSDTERKISSRAAAVTTTVVLCTRDRPDELARCLASFSNQTRKPDEILVIDNASRGDETRARALAAGAKYIREDRAGLDFARNTGAKNAVGDIVAYTDDDVILHPQWLERITDAFDVPEVTAVTGLVLPAELETEAQYIFETRWGFGRGFKRLDFGPSFYERTRARGCPVWEIGAGANMAFRRAIFDQIGYFDERLDVGAAGCSGDSEYWYRIISRGGICRYEPTAVVFHFHRRGLEELQRQIRGYMSGHMAALLVQYERTREIGNLRRAFIHLPISRARRCLRRLLRGRNYDNYFLRDEIMGCLDGILFYFRTTRPGAEK